MAKHKTLLGKILSPFTNTFSWLKNLLNSNKELLKIAFEVTQKIKNLLDSKIADFLVSLTLTKADDNLLKLLREKVLIMLADELLLKTINKDTTEEEAKEISQKILDSFGGLSTEKREKLITTIAAQIFQFVKEHSDGKHVTFGEAALLMESMWKKYQESK